MRKAQIEIGGRYVAKVSGQLTIVHVLRDSPYGGWDAENVETGRKVRIRSPQRLRRPARTAIDHLIALPGEEVPR